MSEVEKGLPFAHRLNDLMDPRTESQRNRPRENGQNVIV